MVGKRRLCGGEHLFFPRQFTVYLMTVPDVNRTPHPSPHKRTFNGQKKSSKETLPKVTKNILLKKGLCKSEKQPPLFPKKDSSGSQQKPTKRSFPEVNRNPPKNCLKGPENPPKRTLSKENPPAEPFRKKSRTLLTVKRNPPRGLFQKSQKTFFPKSYSFRSRGRPPAEVKDSFNGQENSPKSTLPKVEKTFLPKKGLFQKSRKPPKEPWKKSRTTLP